MNSSKTRYPHNLKEVLQETSFENIFDNNMFSSYLAEELYLPQIEEPRKIQNSVIGEPRHPQYVKSALVNQTFSYIGFIKRSENHHFKKFLPILYQELNRFLSVFEEIIFSMNVSISVDIYKEMKQGYENFLNLYRNNRTRKRAAWIEEIWKRQKNYLEKIDMLLETLKVSGRVFDFSDEPLFSELMLICKEYYNDVPEDQPTDADCRFVVNVNVKAYRDEEPKIVWSGDRHILKLMELINKETIIRDMPAPIVLRSAYYPHHYAHLYP